MIDLCPEVRRAEVLLGAWHAIRRNAETSQRPATKQRARDFGANLPANLRMIADRLRKGYKFSKAHGVALSKGAGKTGKRPLVVAPLEDRIVQRAILDVLQREARLPGVQRVLNSETSIGGIPGKGVDNAIELFQRRVEAGDCYVAGSDISGFFTRISRPSVIQFLSAEGVAPDFLDLVDRALTVELANAASMAPEDLKMFPTGDDGVAQGCPLSALAGNIVLEEFDRDMNSRGITCIRYIDDFILIGRTHQAVHKAMESAKVRLSTLKMDIYDPAQAPNKAFIGRVDEGHVFLGYRLLPGVYPPSADAVRRLLSQVRDLITQGKRSLRRAMGSDTLRPHERCYAQTLVAIDHTVRGWRGSFQSSSCPSEFAKIDAAIDRELHDFRRFFVQKMTASSSEQRRRLLRVQLLVD